MPFYFQWISNGFFKWSLRYIRLFKKWPKRGWDGKKLGLRAGYVTLTSWTIWRAAQCMTQSFFIWKFAHLLFFLSHQNLPALNLWCCSEKNPVFKSDKTDKWFKCCGLKSTALEITAPLSASIIHDDPLFGLKLRHKTTAELSHQ